MQSTHVVPLQKSPVDVQFVQFAPQCWLSLHGTQVLLLHHLPAGQLAFVVHSTHLPLRQPFGQGWSVYV